VFVAFTAGFGSTVSVAQDAVKRVVIRSKIAADFLVDMNFGMAIWLGLSKGKCVDIKTCTCGGGLIKIDVLSIKK
jgi:hypothetical protein